MLIIENLLRRLELAAEIRVQDRKLKRSKDFSNDPVIADYLQGSPSVSSSLVQISSIHAPPKVLALCVKTPWRMSEYNPDNFK